MSLASALYGTISPILSLDIEKKVPERTLKNVLHFLKFFLFLRQQAQ